MVQSIAYYDRTTVGRMCDRTGSVVSPEMSIAGRVIPIGGCDDRVADYPWEKCAWIR